MGTLKAFFAAKDTVTGETYAAYCDRTSIGFQEALSSFYAATPGQSPLFAQRPGDSLREAFEATDYRTGQSWAEYADRNRFSIQTFLANVEKMAAVHQMATEREAAGVIPAYQGPKWFQDRPPVPPRDPARDWWLKPKAARPVPASGLDPA